MVSEKQSLRRELDEATLSLGHTLNQIETRVEKTITGAKDKVEEVVDSVTETAHNLSPSFQIRKAPTAAIVSAVALGILIAPRRRRSPPSLSAPRLTRGTEPERPSVLVSEIRSRLHDAADGFRPEIQMAKAWALTAAVKWFAEKVRAKKPSLQETVDEMERHFVDRFRNGFETARNVSQSASPRD